MQTLSPWTIDPATGYLKPTLALPISAPAGVVLGSAGITFADSTTQTTAATSGPWESVTGGIEYGGGNVAIAGQYANAYLSSDAWGTLQTDRINLNVLWAKQTLKAGGDGDGAVVLGAGSWQPGQASLQFAGRDAYGNTTVLLSNPDSTTPSPLKTSLQVDGNLLIGPAGSPVQAINADGSIGVGASTAASNSAVAVGNASLARNAGIAIGYQANAYYNSLTIGFCATTTGLGSIVIGYSSSNSGSQALVLGNNVSNSTDYRLTLGGYNPVLAASESWITVDPAQSGIADNQISFNGLLFALQRATTSAPTYVKGGVWYDSTIGKLVVGGLSGWEVISSSSGL